MQARSLTCSNEKSAFEAYAEGLVKISDNLHQPALWQLHSCSLHYGEANGGSAE